MKLTSSSLSDREKRQLHVGDLRDRAVDLVRGQGRPTSNITYRGALLRICEYDQWPIKIEHWYPRHEVTDPDAMLWHLDVRHKGMPVLVLDWSEEKVRQKTYEPGPWERLL